MVKFVEVIFVEIKFFKYEGGIINGVDILFLGLMKYFFFVFFWNFV